MDEPLRVDVYDLELVGRQLELEVLDRSEEVSLASDQGQVAGGMEL